MNLAREITERLTMQDIFFRYGFNPDKKGNICCPFHMEKEPSLGYYSDGKKWHCFGCNESGGPIDFIMRFFNLSFKQALAKLDYDFNLGLVGRKLTHAEREQARRAEIQRKKAMAVENKIKQEKEAAYNDALTMYTENDKTVRRYKGISKCAFDYPPEYWRALHRRQCAAYLLDCIER